MGLNGFKMVRIVGEQIHNTKVIKEKEQQKTKLRNANTYLQQHQWRRRDLLFYLS